MKKTLILLAILVTLGAVAYFLKTNNANDNSSIDLSDRNFAYENENNIGKIILQKPNQKAQIFERRGQDWYVNDYLVGEYKIPTLLKAITSVRVEHLPPKNTIPTIYDAIKKDGVHVEVYTKSGKKVRSYTVGPNANSGRCTYMLADGKDQPYCMNIKNFGQLRPRFVQTLDTWRDVALFRLDKEDITDLTVEYNKDYTSSFQIIKNRGDYIVKDIGGLTKGNKINQARVLDYLSEYEKLYGEGLDNNYNLKDSVSNLLPFATVTVIKKGGESKSIKLFPKEEVQNISDEVLTTDDTKQIQKYFVSTSDGDFMVAQHRLIRPIFRPYDYFIEP